MVGAGDVCRGLGRATGGAVVGDQKMSERLSEEERERDDHVTKGTMAASMPKSEAEQCRWRAGGTSAPYPDGAYSPAACVRIVSNVIVIPVLQLFLTMFRPERKALACSGCFAIEGWSTDTQLVAREKRICSQSSCS